MTRDEAKAYLQKLATDAGLDEGQRNALAAALGNEKFAESVTDGFMLKSDYSRSKNEVAEEKRKAAEEYAKKYQELKAWSEQYGGTIEQARKVYGEWERYKQTLGELNGDGGGNVNGDQNGNKGMPTLDQFTKLLDDRIGAMANQTGSVIKSAVKMSTDYQKRFGEPIDMDEFDNFFAERQKTNKNLDIDTAYKLWIEPKAEEQREKRHAEELKKAKEEGAQEVRSKLHVPIDSGSRELSPAWDSNKRADLSKLTPEQLEDHAESEFYKAWNEAAQPTR